MKTRNVLIVLLFLLSGIAACRSAKNEQPEMPVEDEVAYDYAIENKMELEEVGGRAMPTMAVVSDEKPLVHNTEEYDKIDDNSFKTVVDNPLSTFSIDVDNAAYSNVRRFLEGNSMPPADAVRIEEMINYFHYDYPQPTTEHPFSISVAMSDAPWHGENKILQIGIQGKKLDFENLKPSNLVFLLDVSGSMSDPNKLPLLKKAFKMLVEQLDDRDRVSIVVYASSEGVVLPPTPASKKETIMNALDKLEAGGSTAGGQGIVAAYKLAEENLLPDGNNRVILATDGDFNVGTSSTADLVRMIEEKRQSGIYLTILGFGMGNYKDGRMEQISNAGNGNYFYIDNILEAEKVFVKDMRANMFTIAKDVKIQVEFNPAQVKAYRLIGYVNRKMAAEDFADDKKDAGELGAGHSVTALYEIVPANSKQQINGSPDLKYQEVKPVASADLLTVKLRYKPINSDKSVLIEQAVKPDFVAFNNASINLRWASAVAGFGMLLRHSEYKGDLSYDKVEDMANRALGSDELGYRKDFLKLVHRAKLLDK